MTPTVRKQRKGSTGVLILSPLSCFVVPEAFPHSNDATFKAGPPSSSENTTTYSEVCLGIQVFQMSSSSQ